MIRPDRAETAQSSMVFDNADQLISAVAAVGAVSLALSLVSTDIEGPQKEMDFTMGSVHERAKALIYVVWGLAYGIGFGALTTATISIASYLKG